MWTIHLLYSDNVGVRDVIIETYPGVHTDGIAIDSSRNVRISNCYIDTGDDGIVIKAGKDADGLRVNRPSENISIVGCTVHRAHGAVTIGSETSGWIRNLVAGNFTCWGTQMGVRLKSRRGRGGGIENVRRLRGEPGWVCARNGGVPAGHPAAKAAGGGTIYVPPGRYRSGPIELFSNMTLDADAGATIEFPVAELPFVKSRYLGVETLAPMPLIGAQYAENVTVTGRGVLTTSGYEAWRKAYPKAYEEYLNTRKGVVSTHGDESGSANGPHWDRLLRALELRQPVSEEEYRRAAAELRPSFISFINAKNVLVEGVRIVGAPMFVIHVLSSENATVHNVMIQSYPGPHPNGIVVDSSRFVRISDSYVDTGDDGIVLKAGKDADGRRVNRPTGHVTITNCTVHHAHGAVVIGSESAGGIRNVVASNITAVDTENGIRIKSRRGRAGTVEGARFDTWTMQNVGAGIVVTSYYVMGGETASAVEPVTERTPVIRNIAISHVKINGAKQLADIDGLPEMPIDGLRLMDVAGSRKAGFKARHTDALPLRQ